MSYLDWSCAAVSEALTQVQVAMHMEKGRVYDVASCSLGTAYRAAMSLGNAAIFRARCREELAWPKGCRLAMDSMLAPVFICVDESVEPGFMVLTASNGDAPPVRVRTCLS